MERNLKMTDGAFMAEALYICLSLMGLPDADEHVRTLTLRSDKEGRALLECAFADERLRPYFEGIPAKHMLLLTNPSQYVGLSPQVTDEVCSYWENRLHL
jgi:adenylosuccinate lyase